LNQTRLLGLDIARSAAILGMLAFHTVFNLQMFGYLPYGTTAEPLFYWHARAVAGSFLALAGLSLWLAHGSGIRWGAFWRRWLKLVSAAALVSLATYAAFPDYFVYFGILHAIAAASLIGLAFLNLPALVTLAVGAFVMAGTYLLPSETFNAPLLRFLGLATVPAETLDFLPIFPWFGPFLLGLGTAQLLGRTRLLALLDWPDSPTLRRLAWPGQHSLMIYLLHQPLLIAAFQAVAVLSVWFS
jgi:uncharacterized membrane protein